MIYQQTRVGSGQALYISGQTPAKNGETPSSIEEQTAIVLEKLAAILEENMLTTSELVNLKIYLTDRAYVPVVREQLAAFIGSPKPTATLVIVAGLVDAEFKVEIDAIASL